MNILFSNLQFMLLSASKSTYYFLQCRVLFMHLIGIGILVYYS